MIACGGVIFNSGGIPLKPEIMTRLAKPMLFSAALIWGTSFFIMKNALDVMPVYYLLAIRFSAGAVLVAWSFLASLRLALSLAGALARVRSCVLGGGVLGSFISGRVPQAAGVPPRPPMRPSGRGYRLAFLAGNDTTAY